MGDGNGILITHTSSTHSFSLHNILCTPSTKKNIISVSKFCQQNRTSVEFFPFSFVVKVLTTGAPLLQGWNRDYLYEWPTFETLTHSSLTAYTAHTSQVPLSLLHRRLRHPNIRLLKIFLRNYQLPYFDNFQSCKFMPLQ